MTRRLPVVLAVIGALVLIAAVLSAMVVRSVDTATVALPERPDVSVVVTEPGVLSAVAPTVTVRASAEDGEPVVLAIGRTSEVEAWLGDAEHARVVGLSSWEELNVEVTAGTPAPELTEDPTERTADEATADATEEPAEQPTALPNPAGSDLWVAEADGTGEVEMSWEDRPGRWSLVAATDGTGPAPQIELEWGRSVSTPWLVPGIVLGGLLLLVGGAMLVLDGLARREQRQRDEARQRQTLEWTPTGVGTVATAPVSHQDTDPGTGERLSRRQIREMERAVADDERRRRRGEVIPPVPQADDVAVSDVDLGAPVPAWPDAPVTEDGGPGEPGPAATLPDVEADPAAPATPAPEQAPAVTVSAVAHEPATPARPGAPADSPDLPATVEADDAIPSDGSTPRRPAIPTEPRGPRAWWARRRTAAAASSAASSPVAPATTGPTPPEPAVAEPPVTAGPTGPQTPAAGPEESRHESETPSWRSVWGFGGATPREDQPDDDTTDEGKEAR